MPVNWSLLIVVGLLFFLRIFWTLYQAYSRQRLRRRLRKIHRQ